MRVNFAKAVFSSSPVFPKVLDTRILCHPSALIQEGPAAPFVCNAALVIIVSSMFSNITGSMKGISPAMRVEGSTGAEGGCFIFNSSITLSDRLNKPLRIVCI